MPLFHRMNYNTQPTSPASKDVESGSLTYLQFAIIASPCFGALIFSRAVLLPRAEMICAKVGYSETTAAWFETLVFEWNSHSLVAASSLLSVFALCRKFWKRGSRVKGWIAALCAGGICFISVTSVTLISVIITTAAPMLVQVGEEKDMPTTR